MAAEPSEEIPTGTRPRVAVTLGDPAGVGPELAVKLLARPETAASADVFVLADESEVLAAACGR